MKQTYVNSKKSANKTPVSVVAFSEALSRKLGRPAVVRQGKNSYSNNWTIFDPDFDSIRRSANVSGRSYTTGLSIKFDGSYFTVWIETSNDPGLAANLRKNLITSPETLVKVARSTGLLRAGNMVTWSSKRLSDAAGGKHTMREIHLDDLDSFLRELKKHANQKVIKEDLFVDLPNAGKHGGIGPYSGKTFRFLVTHGSEKEIKRMTETVAGEMELKKQTLNIIKKIWPLWIMFHSHGLREPRRADLRRRMDAKLKVSKCEFCNIVGLPKEIAHTKHKGKVVSHHIEMHIKGGTDLIDNGIYLCEQHHHLIHIWGKTKGRRDLDDINKINVRFIPKRSTPRRPR